MISADTGAQALAELRRGKFDLVLVNRVLDRTGASGLDFIREVKKDTELAETPVMLVSNYPDAQKQAVTLGALPGFGKSQLGDDKTIERLKPLLM